MGIVVHRGCLAGPEKRYRYITLSSMYCRMVVLSFFLAVVSSSSALMRAAYERCTRPSRDGKVTRSYVVAWHDMVGIYSIVWILPRYVCWQFQRGQLADHVLHFVCSHLPVRLNAFHVEPYVFF